jgi:ABC-type transport system involved in cytochrome c biogenesis permease subunit
MTRAELQILAVFLCVLVIIASISAAWSSAGDDSVSYVVIIAMVGMITCVVRPDRSAQESADGARIQAPREGDRSRSDA